MRGLGGTGLAGAASADGEALEVKRDEESFGFDVVKVDVRCIGNARGSGSVDSGFVDLGEDAVLEAVAQGGEFCGAVGAEPFRSDFGGFAQAHDSSDVLGSGAALALV